MNEKKLEDPLGKPKRMIIITELPARHKMAGETFGGETWKNDTVWRLAVLTSGSLSEMYCHDLDEVIRSTTQVLRRRRLVGTKRQRTDRRVLESIMYRVQAFAGEPLR